jgi:glycosyltransferase involved in cell wall biosynthesis
MGQNRILHGDSRLPELLFSIIIACYNQEKFVKESVESALSQQHPSKEVIVVDDCSSDGTVGILQSFGDAIVFSEMSVNGGACAARNHGVSLARGKYLVFLDGDDVLMSWALAVYERLLENRNPKLILGRSALFYGDVREIGLDFHPKEVKFVEYPSFLDKDRPWVYNTSSLVVERAAFRSSGGWSKGIFYQDIQDLLNKLGIAGTTVLTLSPETVWYRMHSANAIRNVAPFLNGVRVLLERAKAGFYPGARQWQLKRSAWFGGLIFYWLKEALRTGLYSEALTLLASTWWMIFLAITRRGFAMAIGRKPVQSVLL